MPRDNLQVFFLKTILKLAAKKQGNIGANIPYLLTFSPTVFIE